MAGEGGRWRDEKVKSKEQGGTGEWGYLVGFRI